MNSEVKRILDEIDEILKIDRKNLYGADRLDDFSFEKEGKEHFERVFQLLEEFRRRDFNAVPANYITNAETTISEFKQLCERAQSLTKKDYDPRTVRNDIISNLGNVYQRLFECLSKFVDFTIQASDIFRKRESEAEQTSSLLKEQLDEGKKTLDRIKSVAAGVGVAANAAHYRDAKKRYAKMARLWLLSGVVLFVLLLGGVIKIYRDVYHGKEGEFALGYQEVAILFGVVLLLYAIIFCNKNFNTAKHNEVINDNKATALATFPVFDGGARDEITKDQILLYAATAIFANTATGFSKDQGVSLPPTLEVAKRVMRQVESKN